MKKLLALLLVMCLLPIMAAGAGNAVTLRTEGLKITFAQPADTFILTQQSSAEDFAACGMNRDETLPAMIESGHLACIYWTKQDKAVKTFIHALASDMEDLNPEMGLEIRNGYPAMFKADGLMTEAADYVETAHQDYVRFVLWKRAQNGSGKEYQVSYGTFVHGYQIIINTYLYGPLPDGGFLKGLENLAASITFETVDEQTGMSWMDEDGDVVVTLPDAEFFFTPVAGYCLTRETSASVFNRLGMSQREIFAYMQERGVYAILYDEQLTTLIEIFAVESVETDFDEMTAFGEAMMLENYRFGYTDLGYEVTSVESYLAPEGHRFIRVEGSYTYEDGSAECFVEYQTCQAGYAVSITVVPLEGTVTQHQRELGEAVADSLWIK